MEIVEIDPGDRSALRDFVAVANAARRADSPWVHPLTEHEAEGRLRHGWDLDPTVAFLATVRGRPVGLAEYETSGYDNHHLAWVRFDVHPDHRRRGHGSAILAALLERARAEGRTTVGTDGWEHAAATGFASRHGLECRSREIQRRQVLAGLDRSRLDRLHAEATERAAAYELARLAGPVPEEELEAFAVMVAAINDSPVDDLDLEDEVYSPRRIRAYEEAHRLRGVRIHRLYARHRGTGELAGETIVGVDAERPQLGEQHDTSVVRAHRGHRLGLLLKLEMLRWLQDEEPQLESIDTWNAESNHHMIAVNDALGYQVLGRALLFQTSVGAAPAPTARAGAAPTAGQDSGQGAASP
ncbi:GNAT family N-acetyltransferase [Nocardioides sp. MAHUQ-72]|uniref:GNAT family N-acetyltransferase n=1 Tax=unclassified Nocardioides TaxID=2615069 RepID=UPI00360682EA